MGWSEIETSFPIVGRKAQISLVHTQLATLWQEPSQPPTPLLLYFYGMRGMGKTSLLRAVEAEVQRNTPGPGLFCLLIQSPSSTVAPAQTEANHYRAYEEINVFFNDFYQQFKQVAPNYTLVEYERLLANRTLLRDEEGLWLRAKTLASDLLRLHREQHLYLLILEDNVSSKGFQWLSKFFYKDLLIERMLCVAATGYTAPVVSTLSLVQYFKSQPLLPLSDEEARQALAPLKFPGALETQLVALSAGHPASLMEAINCLKNGETSTFFDEKGGLSRVGRAKITEAMARALLQDISATLARCCMLISPLRSFRYDTLAALLPVLMPDDPKYGRAGVVDYMLLGKELNDRIDFIESDKTYVMHPVARAILSNAVKYADIPSPASYRQINEAAAKYYAGLLERLEKPEQRSEALLEELYHQLLLANYALELENQKPEMVMQAVTQVLQRRLPALSGREGTRRLATLLETDRDIQQLYSGKIEGLIQLLYESNMR